jgi:hypothetical protein
VTQSTINKTILVEFATDRYFIEYHDNQVKKRYPFFIRADSLSKRETIDYGKYGFRQEYIFRGDTLLLMDECNDCYPWAYQRVNSARQPVKFILCYYYSA